MGGSGSGRYSLGAVPTVESCLALDLAWMRGSGFLRPGHTATLNWSRGGRPTGSIQTVAQSDGLRLVYQMKLSDGTRSDVDEFVPFSYSATKFSGRRPWLTCLKCGRRCRVLYGGRWFRCRLCHGLRYASQSEPAYQRAIDRADKLRKRVGGPTGAFNRDPFPDKPPRMRWTTYFARKERYDALLRCWAVGVMQRFGMAFSTAR
jgi:hypothetical protein